VTTIYVNTEQTITQNSVKKDEILRNQERIDNLERLLKIQYKLLKEQTIKKISEPPQRKSKILTEIP